MLTISRMVHPQQSENNDFRIGVFMFNYTKDRENIDIPVSSPFMPGTGYYSSDLNVLAEDGINTVQNYEVASAWFPETHVIKILELINNINSEYQTDIKILTNSKSYYRPPADTAWDGENIFNNVSLRDGPGAGKDALDTYKPRPHFDNLLSRVVYANDKYKDIVWGHELTEEACYGDPMNASMKVPKDENTVYSPIPPSFVRDAMGHFKKRLAANGVTHQKIVLMEAYHGRAIVPGANHEGNLYHAPEYMELMDISDDRDVWFEGSYAWWMKDLWYKQEYNKIFEGGTYNYHYLGKFETIDYAHTFTKNVHKVLTVSLARFMVDKLAYDPITYYRYHADLDIKNANWLWFDIYTSIIHGVNGVWFWDVNGCWERDNPEDVARHGKRIHYKPDRFGRENLYHYYTSYLAPLFKEIRYLVDQDLISTDPETIISSKTTKKDKNHILGEPKAYIRRGNHQGQWELLTFTSDNHQSESYGLRYTIRSNGPETIMIIANPLGVPIERVKLDLSNIDDPNIQNASQIHILFKGNTGLKQYHYPKIRSKQYKTIRKSDFGFNSSMDELPYVDITKDYKSRKKILVLRFGPLDVHVIRFVK